MRILTDRAPLDELMQFQRAQMPEVDNRNSSAAKRARTDGSRREDDWTCPSCGNDNFSFRTTCNMRNCTQPRPADHNSKPTAKPFPAPQGFLGSAAPYLGSAAPSSMYLGVPPYGSSIFNGSSVPPYDVPFSGGSAYHYNYGSHLSTGSPYRPLHLSGPTPYSSGSMIGNGGMYGMPPPMMDRFGLGLPMGPGPMGPRPGFLPDDKAQKKSTDATRDNDWACPKCGNVNFSFRTVCNMRKCNTPKPGSQPAKSDKTSKQKMPEGSWKCEKCNNINYPFRTKCNRQNCGADKPAESKKSPSPAPNENNQTLCFWNQFIFSSEYVTAYDMVPVGYKGSNEPFFQVYNIPQPVEGGLSKANVAGLALRAVQAAWLHGGMSCGQGIVIAVGR
ncbi:hypothetical protein ACFX2C_021392 [Malus domestica]